LEELEAILDNHNKNTAAPENKPVVEKPPVANR